MKCNNCIHEKVCIHKINIQTDTYAYMGVRYDLENCRFYQETLNISKVFEEMQARFKELYEEGKMAPFQCLVKAFNETEKKYTEGEK